MNELELMKIFNDKVRQNLTPLEAFVMAMAIQRPKASPEEVDALRVLKGKHQRLMYLFRQEQKKNSSGT